MCALKEDFHQQEYHDHMNYRKMHRSMCELRQQTNLPSELPARACISPRPPTHLQDALEAVQDGDVQRSAPRSKTSTVSAWSSRRPKPCAVAAATGSARVRGGSTRGCHVSVVALQMGTVCWAVCVAALNAKECVSR